LIASALISGACHYVHPATPLDRAAHRGDLLSLRALLRPPPAARVAAAALHWAARGGHPAGPHRCRGQSRPHVLVVEALLDAGADVNAPDGRPEGLGRASGWTPLHVAVHHGQWTIARLLLDRGADPQRASDQWITPRQMAAWSQAEGMFD
jgi:ankyrin repeat protein